VTDRCPGSGKRPKRMVDGLGECPNCPTALRLRKDGKLRSHYRPDDATEILRDLWSLFGRRG
jgi:hypothetical protein